MTRCWDGRPERPDDTRFFDLRESGYRGEIDMDGYAVDTRGHRLSESEIQANRETD